MGIKIGDKIGDHTVVALRGDYAVVDYYGWEKEVWIPALERNLERGYKKGPRLLGFPKGKRNGKLLKNRQRTQRYGR